MVEIWQISKISVYSFDNSQMVIPRISHDFLLENFEFSFESVGYVIDIIKEQ